jgi:hypothetical protein
MKNKICLPLIMALVGSIGMHSVACAEIKYKTSFIGKTDFQSIDWNGGKATVGSLRGVLETYGSTDPKAPNGQSVQNCVLKSVRVNDGTDIQANCTVTDKDGDLIFAVSERKQGDINAGSGGKGKTRYIGGTGKYKGISGGCEYQTKYLPENWLSVESECTRDY